METPFSCLRTVSCARRSPGLRRFAGAGLFCIPGSPVLQGLLFLLVLFSTGCSSPGPIDQLAEPASPENAQGLSTLPESNRRMAERLQALADATDPRKYPYDNEVRAERSLELALSADPGPKRFALLIEAVQELIRSGRPDEALTRLEEAESLLRASGARVGEETEISLLELHVAAGLRLGEQQNCLLHASDDACILPIQATAQHELERGSREAMKSLEQLLSLRPDSPKYRWLLNLAAMTLGEYPDGVAAEYRLDPAALGLTDETVAGDDLAPRFHNVSARRGVASAARAGGAAMEDFDGDGRLDLVASSWGLEDPLRFYRQLPDGSFEDRTDQAWLTGQLGGLNLTHADYDNDGDPDLLVLRGGWLFDEGDFPDSLLRNEGGRFVDVTKQAGLYVEQPAHSGAWADYDGDGHLDLFVGAEPSRGVRHPSRLYHNRGNGTFEEVSAAEGLRIDGIVKAAAWGDYDDDGHADLYVSRFGETNLLFRNLGPGAGFEDATARAGVAEPNESFPAFFLDFDNDGRLDLFVGSFAGFFGDSLNDFVAPYFGRPGGTSSAATSRLYRNRGDGTFEDVTVATGLDRMMLAMGANFGDLDGDGFLDLYLGTGEPAMTTLVPNLALHNTLGPGGGRRFEDLTTATGLGSLQKGHGIAFGDIDGDGDEDLYVTMGGAYLGDVFPNLLFENPGSEDTGTLTLQLRGRESNRAGEGARVTVVTRNGSGARQNLYRVVGTGGSFGSSSLQLEIGLGHAAEVESVDVRWPGSADRQVHYRGVEAGSVVSIPEPR